MKLTIEQWVKIGLIAAVFIIALVCAATGSNGWGWAAFGAIAAACVGGVLWVLFGNKGGGNANVQTTA